MRIIDARRQQPKHDYVLIERFSDTKTEGGILLPERSSMSARTGRVLAVGPGLWDAAGQKFAPTQARKGEVVLYTCAPDTIEISERYVLTRDYTVACAEREPEQSDDATLADLEDAEPDDVEDHDLLDTAPHQRNSR